VVNLLIGCNIIAVIFAAIASWLSIKLIRTTSRGISKHGWWTILPFVAIYALANRIIILVDSLGYITGFLHEIIPGIIVVFYIGFAIFLYGMNKVTDEIISNCK
jgi:hypothetical protein